MSSTLGTHNPLRYRGYVYDTETSLYYLQSRYYNPEIGRFINADAFVSTGYGLLSSNMFAYCGNNPVNRQDHSGYFWLFDWLKDTHEKLQEKAQGIFEEAKKTFEEVKEVLEEVEETASDYWEWKSSVEQQFFDAAEEVTDSVVWFAKDRFSTPQKTANTLAFVSSFTGTASNVYGIVGFIVAPFSFPAGAALEATALGLNFVSSVVGLGADFFTIWSEYDDSW